MSKEFFRLEGVRKAFGGTDAAGMPREGAAAGRATGAGFSWRRRANADAVEVLHGIDLAVNRGDVVAILGPSGSGKTTLLRCANFLERANVGTMVFDGERLDMHRATARQIAQVRRKTAFVFQDYNLFRNRTVLGNVMEGLVTARNMPEGDAREKAVACLERVGMADRLGSYPMQLSGGQQQRVAIARAMATDPEIVFFDEPTSALDPELTSEVLSAMRALADEGMTMVVVTHEMSFARNVADRVVFMEDGRVQVQASARDFFDHPANDRVRAFLRTVEGAG